MLATDGNYQALKAPLLTESKILCCMCGLTIAPNPTNMCVSCLHDNVDITQGINKQLTIHSCRSCGRFQGPPWQQVELESKELMIICLRKIAGLNKVKLIDAVWVWTEPHSLRLKIKLTIQKEIMNGAVLQQAAIVEFTIRNLQCKHCEANYAQGAWKAVVQVRQHVTHKRTFFYLEQLILKHQAQADCIKIVTFRDGMDFYFTDRNQAVKFIDFLQDCVPVKCKYSRKLVTADHKSNIGDFKHNHLIEIAPICKDDLVLLPLPLAHQQSNISPLVIVKKVHANLTMLDPLTHETTEISAEKYWRYSFTSLLTSRQLVKYMVLGVEPMIVPQKASAKMKRLVVKSNKNINNNDIQSVQSSSVVSKSFSIKKERVNIYNLAEVTLMKESDIGERDTQYTCVSHLGHVLNVGDYVLGYDLTNMNSNLNEEDEKTMEKLQKHNFPDVILVRKFYERKGERQWKLKNLKTSKRSSSASSKKGGKKKSGSNKMDEEGGGDEQVEVEVNDKDNGQYDADLEDFLQQVEGDKEMRSMMNLYRRRKEDGGKGKAATATNKGVEGEDEEEGEKEYDEEELRLDELLDEMSLNSDLADEVEEGEEEGDAQEEITESHLAVIAGREKAVVVHEDDEQAVRQLRHRQELQMLAEVEEGNDEEEL